MTEELGKAVLARHYYNLQLQLGSQGLWSIKRKTPYRPISRNIEAAIYVLALSDRIEIWQAPRQRCCRGVWKISKRYVNVNYQSRGFETYTRSYGSE